MDSSDPTKHSNETTDDTNMNRREVLQRLGQVGLYVPPAMLTLLTSRRASAFSPPAPPASAGFRESKSTEQDSPEKPKFY